MAEDFFGNLSKTLKKTVNTVGKKTDEFVEIQKIRTRQHALEDQIEKNYQDIGQIIYNRYLNGEAFDENLAGICKDITDLEKEIADCKEDVANKRGRIVCPACGASVPKDAAFCMRCGAAMPEKEEEPEDAEFVHVEPEEEGKEEVANKRGRLVCPACGASVPKDAAFCMRCGAAMPEKEAEAEDAEFVHVEPEEKGEEESSEEEKTAEEILAEEPEEKAEDTEAAAPEEEPEKE